LGRLADGVAVVTELLGAIRAAVPVKTTAARC
jgi:hypothetical protein